MSNGDNVNDDEFLAAAENVVETLRSKFPSSVRGRDDTEQLIRLFCVEARPKYRREAGKLAAFLFVNARNRLLNESRAEFGRACECRVCHAHACGKGPGHTDGQVCREYVRRQETNRLIQRLAHPKSLAIGTEGAENWASTHSGVLESARAQELLELIERGLQPHLYELFTKMMAGEKLSSAKAKRVRTAIAALLFEVGLLPEYLDKHLEM